MRIRKRCRQFEWVDTPTRRRCLLGALLLFTAIATPGCGEESARDKVFAVGLRSDAMDYHAAAQRASNWCWAACVQMALSTEGVSIPQATIVRDTFGVAVNMSGQPQHILQNLDGRHVQRDGVRHRLVATAGLGPPPKELLIRELKHNTPVIVGYPVQGRRIGHAVVVTAVICERTDSGTKLRRIMVRDPSPHFAEQEGKRRLSMQRYRRIEAYYTLTALPSDG